ncbi:hypothetical protein C7I87_06240 [Mesorhizobium sp. SARCC-RB16n]|nr:hypothetical protein C7I87_06240 [Mesorhizobium sp. SARCC-RB16n]
MAIPRRIQSEAVLRALKLHARNLTPGNATGIVAGKHGEQIKGAELTLYVDAGSASPRRIASRGYVSGG